MLILKRLVVCSFFVFLFSITLFADPIRITTGTVRNGGINIRGDGVSYDLGPVNGGPIDTFGNSNFIVKPGSTVNLVINAFSPNGSGVTSQNYIGGATINGVNYFGNFGGAAGTGNMIFTLGSFVMPSTVPPPSLPNGTIVFTVQVPFTMTGAISGQTCSQTSPCTPIPLTSLYGSGIATLNYAGFNGNYHLSTFSFQFTTTPEPTPEPATLLFFGTGLAGLAGYAAKRRKKKV